MLTISTVTKEKTVSHLWLKGLQLHGLEKKQNIYPVTKVFISRTVSAVALPSLKT